MSDYLWDKTGEPDADVERLEELLGALRHQPQPLRLPPEVVVRGQAPRPFRLALAVAAALALAALSGFWFYALRTQKQGAESALGRRDTTEAAQQQATATDANRANPARTSDEAQANGGAAPRRTNEETAQQSNAVAAVTARSSAPKRRRPADANTASGGARGGEAYARRQRQFNDKSTGSERREAVARQIKPDGFARRDPRPAGITPEQLEAKEQLMLALRLTSAKLSLAQKKIQPTNSDRPAPDERDRLR